MGRNRRRKAPKKERRLEDEVRKKLDLNEKLDKEDQETPSLSNGKTVDILEEKKESDILEKPKMNEELSLKEFAVTSDPLQSESTPGIGPKSQAKHRDYYLHYLCQVCKRIPKVSQRVHCAKCKLVSYCSPEHKREHWPIHSNICEVLAELFQNSNFQNITSDDFRKIRVDIIEKCELMIERPLEKFEKEIVLYFNRCFDCYERDPKLLESCNTCMHISFCKNHNIHKDHKKHCSSLVVYKDIVLRIITDNLVSIFFPDTFSQKFDELNMTSLCTKETDSELESAFLSELATSPLTVLQALKIDFGSYQNVPTKLYIHVIGAENDFELSAIEKWEIFLAHYLPCVQILVIFIGPELSHQGPMQSLSCEDCEACGKNISAKFHPNSLYHDYVQGPNYIKPDLVCSFNPGIYRSTGFNKEDTWQETIVQMLQQDAPVLITAYTELEIIKDVNRIQQTSKLNFLQPPCSNLFSSLKPFLSFVSDEVSPVIFKNHYYTIFKKCQ